MNISKKKFCFIHIEKAGGSTIHNWLKYYIPSYVSLHPWYYWSNEAGNNFTLKELSVLKYFHPNLSGIGGHTTRHFLGYEKIFDEEVNYFTFLREPISRYLSHFQFQKYKMNINWTLDEYINERRFNNYMTIRIAGEENPEKALEQLKNNFVFTGIIEKFNESILGLAMILGYTELLPLYEKVNEGDNSAKIIFEELPMSIQKKIIDNNKLDIILYNEFKNKYYPSQMASLNNIQTLDLETFEKELLDFQYSDLRQKAMKLFKAYNHYLSEPVAHFFR